MTALDCPHSFFKSAGKKGDWCHVCRNKLGKAAKVALLCEVCGYRAHFACAHLAHPTCQLSTLLPGKLCHGEIENSSTPRVPSPPSNVSGGGVQLPYLVADPTPESLVNAHHWRENRFAKKALCKACNRKCTNGKRFPQNLVCTKCGLAAHAGCVTQISDEPCHSPQHELLNPLLGTGVIPSVNQPGVVVSRQSTLPLLVFANRKSGGGQGVKMLHELRSLVGLRQVYDLIDGGPGPGFAVFRELCHDFRVLVCGGDGTAGWVLSVASGLEWETGFPEVAVLPIGTGNDLARTLGWGGGYSGERIQPILLDVDAGHSVDFDRWNVAVSQVDPNTGELSNIRNDHLINYFSLGFDASTALSFHLKREAKPHLFTSRFINKAWYTMFGMKEIFTAKKLKGSVEVEVDGRPIPVPKGIKSLAILNIHSFAGGTDPWGAKKKKQDPKWRPGDFGDGVLELVGLNGPIKVGWMTTCHMAGFNILNGRRLAQGSTIRFKTTRPFAVQVDGEPWLQSPCEIEITHLNRVAMTAKTTAKKK